MLVPVFLFIVPEKLIVNIRQIGTDIPRPGATLLYECVSTGSSDPRNSPVWRNPAGSRVYPLAQGKKAFMDNICVLTLTP